MNNRIGDYYLNCEIRIAEAKKCLEKMKIANNMIEVRVAFMVFLDLTKNLFFPLRKYKSILDGFDIWWFDKCSYLRSNETANFFYKLRNNVIKGADEIIKWNTMRPKGDKLEINGPLMLYEGNVFQPVGNGRWIPHSNVTGIIEWELMGAPLAKNPLVFCSEYIEILENILLDFMNKYPNILSA